MTYKNSLFIILFGLTHFYTKAQTTLVYTSDNQKYNTALELYDKQKYVAARDQFDAYRTRGKNDLKSLDAEFYSDMCGLYLENEGAEQKIESFVSSHPDYIHNNEAFFQIGIAEFSKKNYDKTITYLEKVNKGDFDKDQKTELQYKMAYSYFSKQKFNEAASLFNSLKNSENQYTSDASYYAGYLAYQDNKYDQAINDLQKASSGNAYKALIPYLICSVYSRQKKYDELIKYGEKALSEKSTQNADEIKLLLGDAYFRKKEYKKAISYLQNYKGKLSADQQYRLGFSLFKTGDYQNSVSNLAKVASNKDSISQFAAYYLGLSYIKIDNKSFAIRALDESRKGKYSKELQLESSFLFAKLNYEQSNFSETINTLKNFNKTFPNSNYENEVNELLADAYLDSDNYEAAVSHLENVKKKTPRINAAYQRVTFNKGVELYNQEKYKESIVQFQKAMATQSNPDIVIASHYWIGEAFSVMKNYPEAQNNYLQVIQNNQSKSTPYYIKSKYGLAYTYYNTKDYNKALINFKDYVSALKIAPDKQNYNDAVLRLADCYYVTKEYDNAVKYYNLAIENNTSTDYALYQKGLSLGFNGKSSEAKTNYDILLKTYKESPYYDDALYQKGQLDYEQGNYETSVNTFSQLIIEKPNSDFIPYGLLKRASAYSNQKKYDNSVNDYKKILTDYSSHPAANDALTGLRDALANAGKSEEMGDILSAYKSSNPKASNTESIEYESAKDLYFNEKYSKAIQSLSKYLDEYPNSNQATEAKYYLADSYARTDEKVNSLKYFEQVSLDKKSNFAGKAALKAGEISLKQKDFNSAVKNYKQSLISSRNKKDQFTAYTGLLDGYFELSKFDSANYFADQVILNGGNSSLLQHKAELYKGKIAYQQNNFDKAFDYFLNVINTANDEYGAEAQYLTGDIYYKQKKYKQSLEALFEVGKKFENYDKWRGKSFLLIAENYVALKENFQAKATLKSIIENSEDKELVELAKKRLKEIEE